ncbi:MAG TPA: hypothetical protein VNG69_17050 [Casimicrobiaceae bacterium]|nr:hypothetical protein [Casimicrobiaceae bacterium]
MSAFRWTAWFRPALSLIAAAGVLALSACGGGSGAPNNPYTPGPPTATQLVVVPDEAIAYAGTPLLLSISGGIAPYFAFSANPAALPVASAVSGNIVVLLASNVDTAQPANITIRDSSGQTAVSEVTVRPTVLLPASITIVPNGAPCPGGQACSGQTSVATVRATGAAGTPLAGRQVRFEVVQGTFQLATTNPGSPLASTQTVATDANGEARVIISVPPNTPTQIGLLRAIDLSTGSQVTGQFVIAQVTAGEGVLSVAPSGTVTITGPAQNVCSAGVRASFYVFGGTPPYRVVTNFPDAVTLVGTPVLTNGGGFDVITNGSCFTGLTFAITDATGRTLTSGLPLINNNPGTQAPPAPTPADRLVITPPTQTVSGNCTSIRTYQFAVIGGSAPYSVILGQPTGWTVTGTPVTASGSSFTVSGPGNNSVTVVDSGAPQQTVTAAITCS